MIFCILMYMFIWLRLLAMDDGGWCDGGDGAGMVGCC